MKKVFVLTLTVLVFTATSQAGPITYIHDGAGSGALGSTSFTNASFTITAHADTLDREAFTSGYEISHSLATIWIEGVGEFDFISPTHTFVNQSAQIVGFTRSGDGGFGWDLFSGPTDPLFSSWDLITPIGPLFGLGELLQWQLGSDIETTGGVLAFDDGLTDTRFTAIVPEPATLSMFALAGLALVRRR